MQGFAAIEITMASAALNRRTGADRRAIADRSAVAEIGNAIRNGEIELLFQPQYSVADNRLIGAEALARWRRPGGRRVGGEALFALAARAGRVTAVSRHLADAAIKVAASWRLPLRLSLNVTAADLASASFVEHVLALLEGSDFAAERLTLEITEQSLVDARGEATRRLERLAGHGVHIALDDFGSGFCNFGYLKRLPLHALKLDRSMVEGIADDPRDVAVLRGIVAMAGALGLETVAEGIENEAQRAAIVREGCTAWQGFLGSQPLDPGTFAALLGD